MPAIRVATLFLLALTIFASPALANRYPGSEVFGITNKDGRHGGTLQDTSRLAEGPSDKAEESSGERAPASEENPVVAPDLTSFAKLPKDSLFARVRVALSRAFLFASR